MANRVKEEEKNERIIRGLLKLPDNRRCINCNSLGPQYVCTNFWTFVCTNCSGIHREFTHRVKSISMAKFTSQEVAALQEGGNQRAKEIYFKEWDPQRQSAPDSSNVERLREFIKHVYVDRRYSGERNYDKPPRAKMGDKEDFYEKGVSRSPPYEDTFERRYNDRSSPGGGSDDRNFRYGYDERRSPGYEQESRQYGDYRRNSPARPEIVNDWHRDDRFGNGKKFEDRRISGGDSKLEGRSPERTKDLESSSPPMVRPVREILGENVLPLRITEPPKANGGRAADGSTHTQRTASSSSLGSANENAAEIKLQSTGSLIDFDADPEPPPTATATQAQHINQPQSVPQSATHTNENNWASFDFSPGQKVSQAPNLNTLESVFSLEVSGIPSSAGAQTTSSVAQVGVLSVGNNSPVAPVGQTPFSPFSTAAPAAAPVSGFATFPSPNPLAAAPGITPVLAVNAGNSFSPQHQAVNAGNSFSPQHQQHSFFSTAASQIVAPQLTAPVHGASSHQPWTLSHAQNSQGPLSAPPVQAPQIVPKSAGANSGVVSQPSPAEVKSTVRKELPQNLFASTYSSYQAVPGWQTGPPLPMGFSMQYNTAVPIPTFVQPKSTNPFDVNSESPTVQAQMFPSMASLQGALPNVSHPSGLLRTSSLGTPSHAWMPPQSSPYPLAMPSQTPTYGSVMPYASALPSQTPPYASTMPPHAPTHASAIPQRAYMGPQAHSNIPFSRQQGVGGFGRDRAGFGPMEPDQQMAGRYSAPAIPQPFSSTEGNPFG
ncbi:probable ADP-ribosylation factor GTPase-activating protein AGD14 isoform X2 [Mangifera indica]|uniref:probable ADP-ribosylation factor GTPase-activating protein AGD14 isoform X2 n=1 Tax=Mangifera indica TaxID=29780 RepID=UPI001CFACDCB|nr:probable ADP-ribosylation factor GTPase-activating protein AGD14 isoform X2 [Mangifera indica]